MIEIPFEQRLSIAKNSIRPGAVFRLHSEDTFPKKIKYHLILLEAQDKVHYIFSNSRLWDYQKRKKDLYQLQIEISKGTDSCFNNTCFIDCSRVYSASLDDIAKKIATEFGSHVGDISSNTRERIKQAVKADEKILSNVEKNYFFGL